jgi:hypothetical protein
MRARPSLPRLLGHFPRIADATMGGAPRSDMPLVSLSELRGDEEGFKLAR